MTSLLLLTGLVAFGQDTLRVGHQFRAFKSLERGVQRDIIYTSINGKVRSVGMKIRSTADTIIDGKSYVLIKHHWEMGDPKQNVSFEALCEAGTMRPIQHIRTSQRAGKEAFRFLGDEIVALDTANDNSKVDFSLPLEESTYNWEIDLETYGLIPMRKGYEAVMNFYHAGGSTPPAFYSLKVEGSEKVALPDGSELDCWVLFTDYRGTQPTRFWYTKKGQNFVKMEGRYNQLTIHKVRIF